VLRNFIVRRILRGRAISKRGQFRGLSHQICTDFKKDLITKRNSQNYEDLIDIYILTRYASSKIIRQIMFFYLGLTKNKILHPLNQNHISIGTCEKSRLTKPLFSLFKIMAAIKHLSIILKFLNMKQANLDMKICDYYKSCGHMLSKKKQVLFMPELYLPINNFKVCYFQYVSFFWILFLNLFTNIFFWKKNIFFHAIEKSYSQSLDDSIIKERILCFDTSNISYKPLWVEHFEMNKGECIFVNYSTSNFADNYGKNLKIEYHVMSYIPWKNFFVWSEPEKNKIFNEKQFDNLEVNVLLPNFYNVFGEDCLDIVSDSIVFFPTRPRRKFVEACYDFPNDFLSFLSLKKAYEQLLLLSKSLNMKVIVKEKRMLTSNAEHKSYKKLNNMYSIKHGFMINSKNINFDQSCVVMTLPNSSPGTLAIERGIRAACIYLDKGI